MTHQPAQLALLRPVAAAREVPCLRGAAPAVVLRGEAEAQRLGVRVRVRVKVRARVEVRVKVRVRVRARVRAGVRFRVRSTGSAW